MKSNEAKEAYKRLKTKSVKSMVTIDTHFCPQMSRVDKVQSKYVDAQALNIGLPDCSRLARTIFKSSAIVPSISQ